MIVQGAYYVLTGLWPLVHMRSFLAVTGPKRDLWLANMVGVLAAAVGAALLVSAAGAQPGPTVVVLAMGAGAAFGGIEVVYAARRAIRSVYLADAAVQVVLIGAWVAYLVIR